VVRELGSERRETVRFLSTTLVENCEYLVLVREDWIGIADGGLAVFT